MKYLTNLSPKMRPIVEGLAKSSLPLRGITVKAAAALASESSEDKCYRVAKRLLRRLEKAGVGRYIIGRRGHPSRFVSNQVDLRTLTVQYSSNEPIVRLDKPSAAPVVLDDAAGWSKGELTWSDASFVPIQTIERTVRLEEMAPDVGANLLSKLNLRFEKQYEKVKLCLGKGDMTEALRAAEWFVGYLEAACEKHVKH